MLLHTADLKAGLAKFAKLIPPLRHPHIQDRICLSTADGLLTLRATNFDQTIKVDISTAQNEPPRDAIVEYSALKSAVAAIRHAETEIDIQSDIVSIYDADQLSGGQVPIFKDTEYPDWIPPSEILAALEVPARDLAEAMQFCLPGTAKGDTRYALNGVNMQMSGGCLELASTNTFGLYVYRLKIKSGDFDGQALTPPFVVEWLSRHCKGESVLIQVTKNEIFYTGPGWQLVTRQIEGLFPSRYAELIPFMEDMPGRLIVRRKELLAALKAATPTRAVYLMPADETLGIVVNKDGAEVFRSMVPAAARKCPPVAFDAAYLIDFLAVMDTEFITFRFSNDKLLAVFSGNKTFILMPLVDEVKTSEYHVAQKIYLAAVNGPNQAFPGLIGPPTRVPSFKAVVAYAKTNEQYRADLLEALK